MNTDIRALNIFWELEQNVFALYEKDFPFNRNLGQLVKSFEGSDRDEYPFHHYIFMNKDVKNFETQTKETYKTFIKRKGLDNLYDENGGIPFPLAAEYINFCDNLVVDLDLTFVIYNDVRFFKVSKVYTIYEKVGETLEVVAYEHGYGYPENSPIEELELCLTDKRITDKWFKDLL